MTTVPASRGGRTPPHGGSPRRLPLGGLSGTLVGLLLLSTLTACGAGASPPSGAAYAALGDSYSSGAGMAPVVNDRCRRSGRNYASLVAKQMGYHDVADVTCGGAKTTDLVQPQAGTGNGAQLDAVGPGTRLVTLTIGLNDDNLSFGLLGACLSTSGRPSAACRRMLAVPDTTMSSVLLKAAGRVAAALRLIRKHAPKARVVLVGYPRILPDATDCPGRLPLVAAMEPRMRDILRQVDDDWRRAAAAVGADYLDTWAMSKGHDVCSASPWVNGGTDHPGRAAPMHPLPSFHVAVADAIVALLKKADGSASLP